MNKESEFRTKTEKKKREHNFFEAQENQEVREKSEMLKESEGAQERVAL